MESQVTSEELALERIRNRESTLVNLVVGSKVKVFI